MTLLQPLTRIGMTALNDLLRRKASPRTSSSHERIDAGLGWLCRAQDEGEDRGFSYGYTIKGGWQESYVETTGYIICTFLEAAQRLDREDLAKRAAEAGSWLVSAQLDDGSFPNPRLAPGEGVVFDTGQDLLGLLALAELDPGSVFEERARSAAGWLTRVADDQGRWTRHTFNGIPHAYNTRVAWALALASRRFDDDEARGVAEANLDWACTQQLANGWLEQCAFKPGAPPFTHTTAYAARGLLESGLVLDEERYVAAGRAVAAAAGRHLEPSGRLPGRISTADRRASRSSCLTGAAQFAIVWLLLCKIDGESRYQEWAESAVGSVGEHQRLDGPIETRGAIKGSDPVWGSYAPLGYPNWATKFFVDALLMLEAPNP